MLGILKELWIFCTKMIPVKIKALNQDSSDDSNEEVDENPITKEALVCVFCMIRVIQWSIPNISFVQEQKLQLGYREALVLQKQNKLEQAEGILLQLIENDVLCKVSLCCDESSCNQVPW